MLTTLAQAVPDPAHDMGHNMSDGLVLMAVGMGVVFIALVTLWGVVALVKALAGDDSAPATPATAAPPAPPSPITDPGPTPELVAVITAAATAALGTHGVRVTRITPLIRGDAAPWTAGGRQSHMATHRPARRNTPKG